MGDASGGGMASRIVRFGNVEIQRSKASGSDVTLKYISLLVLVVQNASQVLLIRYARTRETEEMFLSTAAVFWTEVVKLITCILIVIVQESSVQKCFRMMNEQIVRQPMDTLKVCIPSIIYTIQNNLLYIAVSNLAAATFMVTYQLKILTTALFSVTMLRRPLSRLQWVALVILFVGVSVVQLQEQKAGAESPSPTASGAPNSTKAPISPDRVQSPTVGLMAVIVACMLSGFAGIYFEKILKGSDVTVWMRNIQLSVLAIPISYLTMQAKDGAVVASKGMMVGFDSLIWIIVLVYAVGGLTVAVVIKYADNILKGFATSVSILVSCVASVFLFNFYPTNQFAIGTVLVMASIYVYSKYPPGVKPSVHPSHSLPAYSALPTKEPTSS
uniref:UDP-galactose translocator n=1 Tax=Plectus sambesii TaxID=2011161 RepID=A0A914V7E2_9BILA